MKLANLAAAYLLLNFGAWVTVAAEADAVIESSELAVTLTSAVGVASFLVGYRSGRWRALWLGLLVWGGSLAADLLTAATVIDRSDEYEPMAVTGALVFWYPWAVPGALALIALGVGLRQTGGRPKPAAGHRG